MPGRRVINSTYGVYLVGDRCIFEICVGLLGLNGNISQVPSQQAYARVKYHKVRGPHFRSGTNLGSSQDNIGKRDCRFIPL